MTKTTTWRRWRRSARGLTCADCYRKWKRQRQRLTTFPYLNYSIWICFHLAGYWRARAEVEIYVSSCDFYGSTSVDDLLQPGSTFSVARSHLGLSGYNWILFSPAASRWCGGNAFAFCMAGGRNWTDLYLLRTNEKLTFVTLQPRRLGYSGQWLSMRMIDFSYVLYAERVP